MPEANKAGDSCVQPARGPIMPSAAENGAEQSVSPVKKEQKMLARVGKPAPDFEATAYQDGGFKMVSLSEYKGQWVVLCFYPGDFTFV